MLTIAQRRSIFTRALFDQGFRERLEQDPRTAITETLGSALPAEEIVQVLEDSATHWAFVLPAKIEDQLPEPTDIRSAIENQLYSVFRDEPATIEVAGRDPRAFLRERFGVEVDGVDLRRERPGTTVVAIPHHSARGELDDTMLDLVTGGGSPPTNTAATTGSAKS